LAQPSLSIASKVVELSTLLFPSPLPWISASILLVLIGIVLGRITWLASHQVPVIQQPLARVLALWIISTLLLLLSPVPVYAHYIFGSLVFTLLLIAHLPNVWRLLFVLFCVILWLHPTQLRSYTQISAHQPSNIMSCAKLVCEEVAAPLYVSQQAIVHPYHTAYEYRFGVQAAGCQVVDIETQPNAASFMAIVNETVDFVPGKTAFHELSQFGPYQVVKEIPCGLDVSATILSRATQ